MVVYVGASGYKSNLLRSTHYLIGAWADYEDRVLAITESSAAPFLTVSRFTVQDCVLGFRFRGFVFRASCSVDGHAAVSYCRILSSSCSMSRR